jgi:hypothetical protein
MKIRPVKFQYCGMIHATGMKKCRASMTIMAINIQVGGMILVDFTFYLCSNE